MARKYQRSMTREDPRKAKPAGAMRLFAHNGGPIDVGDVVTFRGAPARVRLILPNRSRVFVVPVEVEDDDNPYDRKETRAEDIGAEWR
jgi:hypothetical protein